MVHHCPRCELRFATNAELTEHLDLDHHAPREAWERYRYPHGRQLPPLYAEDVEPPADAPRRYLLVGNQTLVSPELLDHVRGLMAAGPCAFTVLVPATSVAVYPVGVRTFAAPGGGSREDADEGAAQARWRLRQTVDALRDAGAEAHGVIGPADPFVAVQQHLRRESFDGIIVSTLPHGLSRWLGMDLPRRLERHTTVPVTTIVTSGGRA